MIYNEFCNEKVSALGLGLMRLPTIGGKDSDIDKEKSAEMIDYAIKHGINYFDTAWAYHGGNSESVAGEILSKYPRESFFVASKFPGYDTENMKKIDEIFTAQKKKCCVEYFDFYLFHCVTDTNLGIYLDNREKLLGYIKEKKKNGEIRHVGFSIHASLDTARKFIDAYGSIIEFMQIQLNYLDLSYQNAQAKLELAAEKQLPIIVMEPLRGGKLASLSDDFMAMLKSHRDISAAEWGFRYIQSVPEVRLTLSGMSDMAQLKENIRIFSEPQPTSEAECATLFEIADRMKQHFVPCTSCKYCISRCPLELNIPYLLKLYNENTFTGGSFATPASLAKAEKNRLPSACLGCRSCEQVCPQSIKISEVLSDFAKRLDL